jgi:hypothetical protein
MAVLDRQLGSNVVSVMIASQDVTTTGRATLPETNFIDYTVLFRNMRLSFSAQTMESVAAGDRITLQGWSIKRVKSRSLTLELTNVLEADADIAVPTGQFPGGNAHSPLLYFLGSDFLTERWVYVAAQNFILTGIASISSLSEDYPGDSATSGIRLEFTDAPTVQVGA